jgi:hypothetical protein
MTTTDNVDTSTIALINDLEGIRHVLNQYLRKMNKKDMLDLFINRDEFSEQSRLLVSELTERSYSNNHPNDCQFTYMIHWQIDTLITRARQGQYS